RERGRALGVSVASLFHLAWAQVLARLSAPLSAPNSAPNSGGHDVVFGSVLFGRMQGREGADRVLGILINTLPIRIRVSDSVQERVGQTHALLTELLRHEQAPLALAQRSSAVAAPSPLFTSFLNYRHSAAPVSETGAVVPAEIAEALKGIEFRGSQERSNY